MPQEENYYADVGLTVVANSTQIKNAYNKFLSGPQTNKKQEAAFAVLMNPEKREEHDAQPHMVALREAINVKSLNALGKAKTVGKVSKGLAARMEELEKSTKGNSDQEKKVDRSNSPTSITTDTEKSESHNESKDFTVTSNEVKNPKTNSTVMEESITKSSPKVVGVYNSQEERRKRRLAAAKNRAGAKDKNTTQLSGITEEYKDQAEERERLAKEKEILDKIFNARSFASKLRRGFSSEIELSDKEKLMKQEMMTKGLNDIKNIDKQEMSNLSKDAIKKRNSGGRAH